MAEKLKPYGFIRIHRSVTVNISAVEGVQPLPTGEYRLRLKGGISGLLTIDNGISNFHLEQAAAVPIPGNVVLPSLKVVCTTPVFGVPKDHCNATSAT